MNRAEELFHAALELPPEERARYLEGACGADAELRAEVESLLEADVGPEPGFLKPLFSAPSDETPDRTFGSYRTVELLGSGGMGTVWLAEQEEPFRRKVALKILRWMSSDAGSKRRFVEERRLLSRMRHSNVAQVYDAGVSESGEPYLAMEWIDGPPVTAYCDEHRLSVEDRLRLFVGVCAGVAHAHRQGVIHRDLKPSNILVARAEGGAVPKVIDFGIAKELEPTRTALTASGHFLGTPEYMSPEQMSGTETDTRSDVYSLGIVLYELLAGCLPFADRPGDRSPLEHFQEVKSSDAPRPSDRITRLPDTRGVAQRRSTDPKTLRRTLRGDLDWIVGKAMARRPDDRYGSAADLAEDVRRYLERQPVTARPPSPGYLARRFAQRHPVAVVGATTVVVALAAIAVLSWRHSQRLAEEAATTRETLDFLVDLFHVSDPSEARGNSVTAREILDRGAERIRDEVGDPVVRRELLSSLGQVYGSLGLLEDAGPMLEEAADLYRATAGEHDPATLTALDRLGTHYLTRGRYAEGESLLTVVDRAWRAAGRSDDGRALQARHDLAQAFRLQRRMTAAESLFVDVLAARRRVLGDDAPETLMTATGLARTYDREGKLEQAEPLYVEALAGLRLAYGEDHPRTLFAMSSLGDLYTQMERYAEAESLLGRAADIQRRVYGPDHEEYLASLEALALLHTDQGDMAGAEGLFREILEGRRQALGPDHPSSVVALINVAACVSAQQRNAEAESLTTEALDGCIRAFGEDDPYTTRIRFNLALLAIRRGDRRTAIEQLRAFVAQGMTHPSLVDENGAFASLRGDAEFDSLAAVVRERLAAESGAP